MAIERACVQVVRKPWGSNDLRPWNPIQDGGAAIGELWFQRADMHAPDPALLLKLLFTKEPLSIQVHPDDDFARSIGLAHGKSEAWYILSAEPGSRIAIGLKQPLDAAQLRASIEDGSIASFVQWRGALKDDVIFVPAGTIHAIGPGLVLAEIQQRSNATFRLFDHGRQRELHVDNAVGAARAGPAERQSAARYLTDSRTQLVASPHFVLERVDLPPMSRWDFHAVRETWVLVLEGNARIGAMEVSVGDAIFLQADRATIEVGAEGLKGLWTYVGSAANATMLQALDQKTSGAPIQRPPRAPDRRIAARALAVGATAVSG